MPTARSRNPGESSSTADRLCRVSYLYAKRPNYGPVVFGSGLIVGGTGKFTGITGGLAWSYGEQGRKRGLYYLPGE